MNGLPVIMSLRWSRCLLLLGSFICLLTGCINSRLGGEQDLPARRKTSLWGQEDTQAQTSGYLSNIWKPSNKVAKADPVVSEHLSWDGNSDVELVKARELMKAQNFGSMNSAGALPKTSVDEVTNPWSANQSDSSESKPSIFSRLFIRQHKPQPEPRIQVESSRITQQVVRPQAPVDEVTNPWSANQSDSREPRPSIFSRLFMRQHNPQPESRIQVESSRITQQVVRPQALVDDVKVASQPNLRTEDKFVSLQPRQAGLESAVAGSVAPAENKSEIVYLRPGLTLNITVLVSGKKEIEEQLRRISDKNLIELPFLGSVDVRGMEASALSAHLARLYRAYYVDPQVIVDFAKDDKVDGVSPWGFVTVLGRVKKPGRIAIPPTRDLTVSGAIQKADGYDTSARQTAIRVTRRFPDGTTETKEVDLYSVGARGKFKEDLILQPEDVVFVPEQVF